jgi:uncharacterized protein YtpQ (UPF0354 family)
MKRLIVILLCSLLAPSAAAQLMSKQAFTRHFADALRAEAPGVEVVIKAELELAVKDASGNDTSVFLDNAYAKYSADPKARKEVVRSYVRALLETRSEQQAIDRSRIVPVVKDRGWLAETQRTLKARGMKDAPLPVFDDLNDDLVVLYAEDTPNNIRYLTPDNFAELGLKKAQLRALAVGNLKKVVPEIKIKKGAVVSMITAGGDYEASLLLVDDLWTSGELAVDGEIVVAIPARDVLLFTGSRKPGGVARLRQLVSEISEKASYRLTDRLFVYRNGKFRRFD